MRIRNIFNKKTTVGLLTAVILTITSFALAKNAVAMPPFAVGLIDFTATPQNNAALLEWETATELGAAGFGIQRKQNSDDFVTISGFINAIGDGATGASYSYLDETAVNGQTYTYQLIEYENDNSINELEQVEVTIGVQPTATPVTIGGGDGNNSSTATPASTNATSTPRSTARASEPTATTRATTTSPTIVPTSRATAVSNNSTATRTTSSSPTATAASSNSGSTVFAQADDTPTPLPTPTLAYPASTTDDDRQPIGSTPYPADNVQPAISQTATPYPAITIEETTGINSAADNGTNVIGSGATSDSANRDNVGESANNSTLTLWAGFLIALFIFIAGLIGTAVLFTRKK